MGNEDCAMGLQPDSNAAEARVIFRRLSASLCLRVTPAGPPHIYERSGILSPHSGSHSSVASVEYTPQITLTPISSSFDVTRSRTGHHS